MKGVKCVEALETGMVTSQMVPQAVQLRRPFATSRSGSHPPLIHLSSTQPPSTSTRVCRCARSGEIDIMEHVNREVGAWRAEHAPPVGGMTWMGGLWACDRV